MASLLTMSLVLFRLSSAQAQTYSYDAIGQLTGVSYPSGEVLRYRYDLRGNLIGRSTYLFQGQEMFVLPEADWAFWDAGSAPPGVAGFWRDRFYDDSLWPTGPAKLGYGSGETTTVSFGPDPNARHITTFFRTRFEVSDPAAVSNLWLHVLGEDGAIVYLNGTEVFRHNMPAVVPTDQTLATAELTGTDEETFVTFLVPPVLLVPGANVLAAEVHLASPASPDMGFNLALKGGINHQPPMVSLLTPVLGELFVFGSNVVMKAYAVDADDGVAWVDFLDGNQLIQRDVAPPYEAVTAGLAPGNHALTARAVDFLGLEAVSDLVYIYVQDSYGTFMPVLHISLLGASVVVEWEGDTYYLQTADQPEGPWTTVLPAVTAGPFIIANPETSRFFRLSKTP